MFRRLVMMVVAAFVLAVASRAAAAPAMWVVKDADSEIYLFGAMHVIEPGLHWRTPAYDDAYARATTVWFETDAAAPREEVSKLMATYGMDPARPLSRKLGDHALAALRTRPGGLGPIDHLRPWAVAMMLQVAPMTSAGYSVEAGADAVVTVQARGEDKPVRWFESLEDQIRMFATLPEAVEVQYLTDVIDGFGQTDPVTLERTWITGDLDALGPVLVDPLKKERPALYDVILKRRNAAWADVIAQRMSGKGVELVNVGALHMVGEDSLPTMMAARGFTVERVQ